MKLFLTISRFTKILSLKPLICLVLVLKMYIIICTSLCFYVHLTVVVHCDQRKTSDPTKLELQAFESYLT